MKLGAKTRNALPASDFALPSERKYPMPDASHAANAKARATQQFDAGNLSAAKRKVIDALANRKLGRSR